MRTITFVQISYLEKPVFLIGMMGSGKTYWARHLGEWYGVPWYDLDAEIEKRIGKPIAAMFADEGEQAFRALERDVLQLTDWPGKFILSCGGGLPCYFDNMEFMRKHGTVVFLHPSVEVLARRLWHERNHRPLLAGVENMDALRERINTILASRMPFYERAQVAVTNDTPTLQDMAHALEWTTT